MNNRPRTVQIPLADYCELVTIGNLLAFRARRAEAPDPRLGDAWDAVADRIGHALHASAAQGASNR